METISSSAFLSCAACTRRIELTFGSGLVLAGVFGAWVVFRPRYEPGRWLSTLCWTFFGTLTFLLSLVLGPGPAVPFLACWTASLVVGAIREYKLRPGSGSPPIIGSPSAPAAPNGLSFGFNASVIAFFALAVVLRLGTLRLGSGSF